MGDDLQLQMACISADKIEYEGKSIWCQSESDSKLSDQDTFFHALFCKICLSKNQNFLAPIKSIILGDKF